MPKIPAEDPIIGWLVPFGQSFHVIGACCIDSSVLASAAQVSLHNVLPYRQSCMGCGATLVKGQSSAWPVLFDGSASQLCR